MSSGRDNPQTDRPLTSSIVEIHLTSSVVNAEKNLPPKARSIGDLYFPNKQNEDAQPQKTAHLVNTARKKNTKHPDIFYFFKYNDPGAEISELEAACCGILQFLAPDNVSPARAYYDEKQDDKFVGVTSKAIPGFKSNREDPLEEEDIIVEVWRKDIEDQRASLQKILDELIRLTDRTSQQNQSESFLNRGMQVTKNFFNSHANSASTAVNFHEDLLAFNKNKNKFTQDALFSLKKTLQARKDHIQKNIYNTSQYNSELTALGNAILRTDFLFKNAYSLTSESIARLEELDRIARVKGKDLNALNENNLLSARLFEHEFKVRVKALKNYRIVKGQAIGECARFIGKDPDGHNKNMNKYGQIIDFDMAKLNLLFRFRHRGLLDRMLREPSKKTFVVTERDIRFFPDIRDADFFYWPTKQSNMTQSVVDTIPKLFENFFTPRDNEIYKKLAYNQVFIFHKFKTFLKYILGNIDIYSNIVKLHLRTDTTFTDADGQQKNLFNEFVKDEAARIEEIAQTLIPMQEFRDFLSTDGELAFKLIKDEFIQYRTKYESKLSAKPYYKALVDSINIAAIEQKYRDIFRAAGAEKLTSSRLELPLISSISVPSQPR